jgi:phenylalanine-4-hydroxylase
MDLTEIGFGDVDWIHLAQDRDRWRALVNTVMNLRVSKKCREFLDWLNVLLASQEGLCSMELVR